jgi:hypothetical protein
LLTLVCITCSIPYCSETNMESDRNNQHTKQTTFSLFVMFTLL